MADTALTDAQLAELAKDSRFMDSDMALLTPSERTRFAAVKARSSTVGKIKDFGTGVVKGAADTAVDLGNLVHNIPGIGNITDMLAKAVGPEGTNPDTAFEGAHDQLASQSPAESAGKLAEGVGEFFVPAGPSKMAAVERLAKMIPDAASEGTVKTLNKVASIGGRSLGEAGSATALSALHGDENPETEGLIAGAGPLVGGVAGKAVKALATPLGRKLFPIMAGGGILAALPNIFGLGASMGTYGLLKEGTKDVLDNPRLMRTLSKGAEAGAMAGSRATAGAVDQLRLQRRRLPTGGGQ